MHAIPAGPPQQPQPNSQLRKKQSGPQDIAPQTEICRCGTCGRNSTHMCAMRGNPLAGFHGLGDCTAFHHRYPVYLVTMTISNSFSFLSLGIKNLFGSQDVQHTAHEPRRLAPHSGFAHVRAERWAGRSISTSCSGCCLAFNFFLPFLFFFEDGHQRGARWVLRGDQQQRTQHGARVEETALGRWQCHHDFCQFRWRPLLEKRG